MSSKHSMNFYDLLGVSPDADLAAIEKAFRAISLTQHPDRANAATRPKSGGESSRDHEARERSNNERYVKIVEARDTLIDDRKREAYDMRQGIRDYPSQSTSQSETKSKSKSKSESKSKSRSTPGSAAEPPASDSASDLIDCHLSSLEVEISCIKDMDHKIHGMLYTLESAARRSSRASDWSETISLLESILSKSRRAKEDINSVIKDLEALSTRSLSDSKKKSQAEKIYDSATKGVLGYIHKAEKTVEELESVVAPIG
ncbi:hypothetical protein F4782DRAFT_501050 [Xylaria castorea]|nr:hypothetical protein F4782DRAFT_501050 [Xylaria castorea]